MTVKTFGSRSGVDFSGTIQDTYVVFFSSGLNSASEEFRVGSSAEFDTAHAWLKIPSLTSDIGATVVVSAVSIELYTNSNFSGTPVVAAYQCLESNINAEINWFNRQTSGPLLWTNEGGLGNPSSGTTVLASCSPTSTYQANTLSGSGAGSNALCLLFEGWINGTITNNGLILANNPDGAWDGSLAGFSSSEYTSDVTQRPLVTITYTVSSGASPEGSRRRRTTFRPGDKGTFSFGLGRFFQTRAANASNGIKAALPSSGALVGQLGGVAGTATHSAAAATHPTSGALTGQLGGVAGSAAHATLHATSGALTGQIGGVGASAVRGIIPPTSRRKGGMWVKGKPPAPKPDAFADSLHRPFTPPSPVADAPDAESVVSPPPVNIFAAPSLAQALVELRTPPKPPSPHAPPRVRPVVEIPADILALLAKLK